MSSEIGDRGIPALAIVSTSGYASQISQGKYTPLIVDTDGGLKTALNSIAVVLKSIFTAIVRPPNYDASLNRTRQTTIVESGTITTVTTVTTVTGLTNLGSYPADTLTRLHNINAWANTCRALIT